MQPGPPKTRAKTAPQVLKGTRDGERFRLDELIGEGGMGQVYRGTQQPQGRLVAIKVLREHLTDDSEALRRFRQEALALSRIDHPNVVTLIDFGQTDDGRLFLVMPFYKGPRLDQILAKGGRLEPVRAIAFTTQILRALAVAHAAGIVHRDLKPSNILMAATEEGRNLLKVIDFGIAFVDAPGDRLTKLGFTPGTPDYMSPEQAEGEIPDGRSDLYTVGLLLFEMLEGRRAYSGPHPYAILHQQLHAPAPELSEDIPPSLRAFVARLLAKDPNDRPAHASAALDELNAAFPPHVRRALASQMLRRPRSAANRAVRPAPRRTEAPQSEPTPAPTRHRFSKRQVAMLVGGLLCLAMSPLFLLTGSDEIESHVPLPVPSKIADDSDVDVAEEPEDPTREARQENDRP